MDRKRLAAKDRRRHPSRPSHATSRCASIKIVRAPGNGTARTSMMGCLLRYRVRHWPQYQGRSENDIVVRRQHERARRRARWLPVGDGMAKGLARPAAGPWSYVAMTPQRLILGSASRWPRDQNHGWLAVRPLRSPWDRHPYCSWRSGSGRWQTPRRLLRR